MEGIIVKNVEIYSKRTYLYDALSYIYIIDGMLGCMFTLLVLYSSFSLFNSTKNPHFKICFWILIVDFILSLTLIFMGLMANIRGEYLPQNQWFCGLIDILYIGGYYLSGWFVALISLERGLLIIHKISLPISIWLIIMFIEVIGFFVSNLIQIIYNQMGLAELGIYCMSTPDYSTGLITLNWYFVMMCLSLFAVIYSYTGIAMIQRRRAWNDIRELNMDKNETLTQANKVIGKVVFLLILYLACNLTEFINTCMELITGETRTALADFCSIIMLNFNPTINCMILIQFPDKIKYRVLETYPILAKLFYKRAKEEVDNNNGGNNLQFRSVLNGGID